MDTDASTLGNDSDTTASGSLFLSFFYRLRSRGLKVTPTQWLTLVEGLVLGLHGASLIGFYSLARSILVKDESELDDLLAYLRR